MTLSEPEIGAFVAVLARVGGLAATTPVVGDSGVSVRARLVFVMIDGWHLVVQSLLRGAMT